MSVPLPNRAILVSVGGSPTPVLHVLRQHRPEHVWYFCSPDSRAIADAVQTQLDWQPAPRFIEVARFEELGPCYRALRAKLPEILTEARVTPAEVLVDYTGGTKTMSAALVLAATEWFGQFSYVGGAQRGKGGLGVTIDGHERVHYQGNPWSELAIREVERARDLWAGCQFEAAAKVLRAVAPRAPRPRRFEAMADLADAFASRHRLDFKGALRMLGAVAKSLPTLLDGRDAPDLRAAVDGALTVCYACSRDAASESFLRELLDNTLRTASQQRYEDAAARLYRAMEMRGQLWLAEATTGVFVNGRCPADRVGQIPAALRTLPFCSPDAAGRVDLSLEQAFRALHGLGDPRVARVVADLDQTDTRGKPDSRWRQATEKRNTSILAHGVQPIGAEGFEQMKRLASEFLDFDLSSEAMPIPALAPLWFD